MTVQTASGAEPARLLADGRLATRLAPLMHANVVEIVAADGSHRFGIVEHRDELRDLALIRLAPVRPEGQPEPVLSPSP